MATKAPVPEVRTLNIQLDPVDHAGGGRVGVRWWERRQVGPCRNGLTGYGGTLPHLALGWGGVATRAYLICRGREIGQADAVSPDGIHAGFESLAGTCGWEECYGIGVFDYW